MGSSNHAYSEYMAYQVQNRILDEKITISSLLKMGCLNFDLLIDINYHINWNVGLIYKDIYLIYEET